jgi:hypothetical protein
MNAELFPWIKSSQEFRATSEIFKNFPKLTIASKAKIGPVWSPCLGIRNERLPKKFFN